MHPSLFISHCSPNTILYNFKTNANLRNLAKTLNKPKYIVMVSAHWCTNGLKVINPSAKKLMYDFYGFEKELYEVKYEISSDESYTNNVLKALEKFDAKIEYSQNSFDHGIWTVLHMMYKELEVPVIQISLPMNFSNEKLYEIGVALQSIRNEAMIIASGSLTHNFGTMVRNSNQKDKNVLEFENLISNFLENGFHKEIINYELKNFRFMHPTDEHFKPIFVAMGSSINGVGQGFNDEIQHQSLSMKSFIFRN